MQARVIAPEDLVVVKVLAADEHVPRHWHDALGILSTCQPDWAYLTRRARQHGIRRVLSLLLYAESRDTWVPEAPLCELFSALHPCAAGRSA